MERRFQATKGKLSKGKVTKMIETTTELAEIIKSAKPAKEPKKKGHPAKQIFRHSYRSQWWIGSCRWTIQQAMNLCWLEGRISCDYLSFVRDRLTKQLLRVSDGWGGVPCDSYPGDDLKPKMELVNRKPYFAEEELEENNRSLSAKITGCSENTPARGIDMAKRWANVKHRYCKFAFSPFL